jgi:hypothetical protein
MAKNAASVARASCPTRFAAVWSAATEADAHIVDRLAVIHFTFIVFFTPRIVIFTVRFDLRSTVQRSADTICFSQSSNAGCAG